MPDTLKDGTGGPIFIPISLIPDYPGIVTGPTVVNFTITVPNDFIGSPITVSFFEVQNQPQAPQGNDHQKTGPVPGPSYQALAMQVLPIANPPIPTWTGGTAGFTFNVNASIFAALSSTQTLLAVVAEIPEKNSLGMYNLPISLASPSKD